MKKLRGTEYVAPVDYLSFPKIEEIVNLLFPRCERTRWNRSVVITDDIPEVLEDELIGAVKKSCSRKAAPGLDGITASILRICIVSNSAFFTDCFNKCFKEGVFPSEWKRARLVLLRKPGRLDESPSSFRPICLLSDLGKLLERIIFNRIVTHLESGLRSRLSHQQYGFRTGRSTCDALIRMQNIVQSHTNEGEYCLAISIDIRNAFNSLPWRHIVMAEKQAPKYLIRIITDYLSDREILVVKKSGQSKLFPMTCGVPQGSVLGPLLWNITYDCVLNIGFPLGSYTLCFADDTLVIVSSRDINQLECKANIVCGLVVNKIKSLGLEVAPNKTEAVLFCPPRIKKTPMSFTVGGVQVKSSNRMKYLDIIVDNIWSFTDHFEMVSRKSERVISRLNMLMPNLRGPKFNKRKLYSNVVHSILLYGAPLWATEKVLSRKNIGIISRIQRRVATRVIAAYRTVSLVASLLLTGLPFAILARGRSSVYREILDLEYRHQCRLTPSARNVIKAKVGRFSVDAWKRELEEMFSDDPAYRTRRLIVPYLDEWLSRPHGQLNYRMTQVLSGHGCFSTYLRRIEKWHSDECEFCSSARDDAYHTMFRCEAWSPQREYAEDKLGVKLSEDSLIPTMLIGKEEWGFIDSFVGEIMSLKEDAERGRQGVRIAAY